MAIVRVSEIWDGRGASLDDKGERTYTRTFRVFTNDATTGSYDVIAAPGIPERFDPYEDGAVTLFSVTGNLTNASPVVAFVSDLSNIEIGMPISAVAIPSGSTVLDVDATARQLTLSQNATATQGNATITLATVSGNTDEFALAKDITARQSGDDPFTWLVEVHYSTVLEEPDYGNLNPLLRPAEIEWSNNKYTRPQWITVDGKGILNSAGDAFDPPYETEDTRITLTITRNEADYDPVKQIAFNCKLNSDVFFGFAAETIKCLGIKSKSAFEKAQRFYVVTYEFEIRLDGWQPKLLDQGIDQIGPDGVTTTHILDPFTHQPVTTPKLLDGKGKRLVLPAQSVFLTFQAYYTTPFAPLGLSLS